MELSGEVDYMPFGAADEVTPDFGERWNAKFG
jgi:hypothetical protein